MEKSFTASILLLTLSFAGIATDSAFAQSQAEMNREALSNFEKADKEMNKTYNKLLSKIDKESQEKLKISQRAWIAFRDAQADLISDFDARGGSMAPMIYEGTRADLTAKRTKQLEAVAKEYAQ